jgi:RNA polymerase sigma-70 factor (ECF subfamily)
VPFASLARQESDEEFSAVDADRFVGQGDGAGSWAAPPVRWWEEPERALDSAEAVARIETEIAKLPETQRLVITMRDVEGMSSEEVRSALDISETNQRVLLHRARAKVRAALEDYYTDA